MADSVQAWVAVALLAGAQLAALSVMLGRPAETRRMETAVGFRAECQACPLLQEPPTRGAGLEGDRDRDVRRCLEAAEVYRAQAVRDLAYDLQRARTEQALVAERMGIGRVAGQKRVQVEDLEIERRSKELVHQVHRPADAERYRVETLAAAEVGRTLLLADADAQAVRLRGLAEAEAIRAIGLAEAEVMRQKALAEAEGLRARLLAEAEGMRQKAAVWERCGAPASTQAAGQPETSWSPVGV
jgi:hypothetical protein